MRKTGYLLFVLSLFVIVAVPGTSFSWECVGPDDWNCLECHPRTDLHAGSHGALDCYACHCKEEGVSNCGSLQYVPPVDTFCCTECHNGCFEVNMHTANHSVDCLTCHPECDGVIPPTTTTTTIITTTTTTPVEGLIVGDGLGFPGSGDNPVELILNNPNDRVKLVRVDICDVDDYLSPPNINGCETTDRSVDFSCLTGELQNGCVRVVMWTLQGLIEKGAGPVLTILYDISAEAPSGECRDLHQENVMIEDGNGDPVDMLSEPGEFCFEPMTTIPTTTTTTIIITTTTTTTSPYMHNALCKECHEDSVLHAIPAHSNCLDCHTGTPEVGNVDPGKCDFCHPTCNNVKYHDLDIGTDCLTCHAECLIITSTTTSIKNPSYSVSISPASAVLDSGATAQFSARTTEDGEEIEGAYIWEIVPESIIGSEIDKDGLFTAGENITGSGIEETVKVTDTERENKSATAMVTILTRPNPPQCEMTISPSTATVSSGNTISFAAVTTGEGCLEGSYHWVVSSTIGSHISDSGVFTAGDNDSGGPVTDIVTAEDVANGISADVMITVSTGKIVQIMPDPLWRSRWIPMPCLMNIVGEDTSFTAFETTLDFQPEGSVLSLFKLVLSETSLYNFVLVLPVWLSGEGDQTVTLTVTTGEEVVSKDFDIRLLPFILDKDGNK